jgi:hypothetical protein
MSSVGILATRCPQSGDVPTNDPCHPCGPKQPPPTNGGNGGFVPPAGCVVTWISIAQYQIYYSATTSNPGCPQYDIHVIGSASIPADGSGIAPQIAFGHALGISDYGPNSPYAFLTTWVGYVVTASIRCTSQAPYSQVILDSTGVPRAGIYGFWTDTCKPIPSDAGSYTPGGPPPADAVGVGAGGGGKPAPDTTAGVNAVLAYANATLGNAT